MTQIRSSGVLIFLPYEFSHSRPLFKGKPGARNRRLAKPEGWEMGVVVVR